MAKTVVGLMDDFTEARSTVRDLAAAGFRRENIGLVANEKYRRDLEASDEGGMAKGAVTGATTGAVVGGAAGLLAALVPLAIPGIGPFIAAGPIAAALAGAGIGAVAGGLIGSLVHLGVPEEEAHTYAEGVRRGGTLVTATADTDAMAERAAEIMRSHGAVDIDKRAESWRKAGWTGKWSDQQALPVVEEDLAVGKRQVSRAAVKVYSQTAERPVEESVRLREGKAGIERRPVDRPVSAADQAALNDRVYEIEETAEEPVVEKRARVKEEVVRNSDAKVERVASGRYEGPERRVSTAPYAGNERRRLI